MGSRHSLLNTKAYDPTDAVFGKDLEGNTFHTPLSKGPHWIVAGQSGSGKSVYMNSILCSLMYHSTPEELIIMAIDPKQVEFGNYTGLPFVPVPPVTNMGDAYGLLAYLVWLMDERYNDLKVLGVKNIEEYNEIVRYNEEDLTKAIDGLNGLIEKLNIPVDDVENHEGIESFCKEHIEDYQNKILNASEESEIEELENEMKQYSKAIELSKERIKRLEYRKIIEEKEFFGMEYIVCVIDEYADMVMQEKTVEDLIIRLAQKARAAGITLLIATQRPSADIISPTIKANVPARIGSVILYYVLYSYDITAPLESNF